MSESNETRIVIYDLTGNNQVLNSYDNEDTFQQDNKFVYKSILSNNDTEKKDAGKILLNDNNNNKISTIDDVIDLLESKSDFIDYQTITSNINCGNSLYQSSQYILYNAKEEFKTYEFFIKCDDRCYLKFKLPLIFDYKTKMLYNGDNKREIYPAFYIPDENNFVLSTHKGKNSSPTQENMLHAFSCYTSNDVKIMGYKNLDRNIFDAYQYLVGHNANDDFQSYSLGYFQNIHDGVKSKGLSVLPKTLLGCSSYDNVTANLCCLDCRCDWPMPEPKTMKWKTIIQKFNLNDLNGLQKDIR